LGRREQKRETTRKEILAAARKLFESRGYEETSVDDIMVSADLSKGTFYYHFASKEELLAALQESVLEKAVAETRSKLAKGAKPLKLLTEFVADVAHWTEANPEFARALMRQRASQFSRADAVDRKGAGKDCPPGMKEHPFRSLVLDLLNQAQKAGEIRADVEARELMGLVMPVIMHAKARWLFNPQGSLSANLERRLQLLIEGLRPGSHSR
jgi:AcrR family transcriptional regulator